ncbi:hypothetical protein WBJ53_01885 [Spirosoma sp. SC4-14]|uniref:hypothetical protein n=1 Tax=Spirosoma sp. SC4-14 TaxID=3128900 RepID=UPI0030CE4F64
MKQTEARSDKYTPGSVPTANQMKVYYSQDVQAAGGVDAWLKAIGSDKAKPLPEINLSEEEWEHILKENA